MTTNENISLGDLACQEIDANSWKSLIEWLKQTKDEEDTDIYEFLDECLGVNASGEKTYVDVDESCMPGLHMDNCDCDSEDEPLSNEWCDEHEQIMWKNEDCGDKENPIAKKCEVRSLFGFENWKIKCPKCWKEEDEDEEYSYYSERYEGCNFNCFRKDYDNVMSDIVYAQQVGLFDQAVWNNLKV